MLLLPLPHLQNKRPLLIKYHISIHFIDLNELFIRCFLLFPLICNLPGLILWSYLITEFFDAFETHFSSVKGFFLADGVHHD